MIKSSEKYFINVREPFKVTNYIHYIHGNGDVDDDVDNDADNDVDDDVDDDVDNDVDDVVNDDDDNDDDVDDDKDLTLMAASYLTKPPLSPPTQTHFSN